MEITTVSDELIVLHDGCDVYRYEDLQPETQYTFHGLTATTLARPEGELLSTFATVNDVHFGEVDCGVLGDNRRGPIQRSRPGDMPYPEIMNRGACAEILATHPAYVIVKGDLTHAGSDIEFDAFRDCYVSHFADKLRVIRGNHDAYLGQHLYDEDLWIEMPGMCVALMDTAIPTETTGDIATGQLAWLSERAASTDLAVLVMGHHQQWTPDPAGGTRRNENYFGINPDSSDALNDVVAKHRNIIGYTAGHTHRHRVRSMACGVPTIEVGCVKDFPGTWAQYRVYEGGVMQVVHRISSPDALEWSERCRHLYADTGMGYESYALGTMAERCFVFSNRS